MKTPVDQTFFRDDPITNTANAITYSDPIDVRLHGADRTKDLVVRVHLNNAKAQAAGSANIVIETSAEGKNATATQQASADWAACGTAVYPLNKAALDDNAEIIIPYPKKPKQFLRLKVTVGTQFTEAPVLFAGLDADAEWGVDEDLMETR